MTALFIGWLGGWLLGQAGQAVPHQGARHEETQREATLGDHGQIHVENFTTVSGDEAGGGHFAGTGNPMIVEDRDLGIRLEGRSMDVVLAPNAAGKLTLSTAKVDGDARVFFASWAKNVPTSRMTLTSSHIDYATSGEAATVTCVGSVDYTDDTRGDGFRRVRSALVPIQFVETAHLTGTSGRLVLAQPLSPDVPASNIKPRSLHLDGPVHYDLTRAETGPPSPPAAPRPAPPTPPRRTRARVAVRPVAAPPAGPPAPSGPVTTLTQLHADSDRFDADFPPVGEATITLDGNVAVTGNGPPYDGTTWADRAVMNLDQVTRAPLKYVFTGAPAVSTLASTAAPGGKP